MEAPDDPARSTFFIIYCDVTPTSLFFYANFQSLVYVTMAVSKNPEPPSEAPVPKKSPCDRFEDAIEGYPRLAVNMEIIPETLNSHLSEIWGSQRAQTAIYAV
jgi:hypothetical protein